MDDVNVCLNQFIGLCSFILDLWGPHETLSPPACFSCSRGEGRSEGQLGLLLPLDLNMLAVLFC